MKKQVMASVLLASIMFAVPGYAAYALTPDDYDSDDKYKSPLEQSYGPVVNDRPKAESADEGEAFALAAEQLIQRDASNKDVSGQNTIMKEPDVTSEQNAAPADKTKKGKESKPDKVAAATKAALEKAGQQAEKVLSETDDSFEPAQDKDSRLKKYCRKQMTALNLLRIKSIPDRSIRQAGRLNPILNQRILGSTCSRGIIRC